MENKKMFYWVSVILFAVLFYDQFLGINMSILALVLFALAYYVQSFRTISNQFIVAIAGGVIASLSFAFYGDFLSFMIVFISLHWVAMLMYDMQQKLIKLFVLAPFNYLMILPSVLSTKLNYKTSGVGRKVFAYAIVPVFITSVFVALYIASSDLVTDWFYNYKLVIDFKFHIFLIVLVLGIVWMYVFWYFNIPRNLSIIQNKLPDSYVKQEIIKGESLDMMRKSAEITFVMLNLVLFIFIVIYSIENFTMIEAIESVSSNVHKRIYAVIFSIVLAISLIMYFFSGKFDFDEKNRNIKRFANIWIGLNAILIFIAFTKNVEYVHMLGLTEKRIGVFVFLNLCWIGLYLTFKKISLRKTNWYLVNRMTTVIYITLLLLSVFNWGWIITKFNIETDIPIENELWYYKHSLSGNEVLLYDYFVETNNHLELNNIIQSIDENDAVLSLDGELQTLYKQNRIKARISQQ